MYEAGRWHGVVRLLRASHSQSSQNILKCESFSKRLVKFGLYVEKYEHSYVQCALCT